MQGTSNFNKVLEDDFIKNHLQPAVALAIATKMKAGTKKKLEAPTLH